jgi:hypothetical protein
MYLEQSTPSKTQTEPTEKTFSCSKNLSDKTINCSNDPIDSSS